MPAMTLYLPDLLLADGHASASLGLLVDGLGCVAGYLPEDQAPAETNIVRLPGRALFPGLANAHSHTFQRLFRGRAEGRAAGGDTFWTWREQMYRAAGFVAPEDLFHIARATFLEMLAAGITVVGEFHYLHRDRSGQPYAEPNLLAHQVIAAAQSVGMRICLLRSAYFRAGFEREPHPGQRRFYERPDDYLQNLADLIKSYQSVEHVTIGAAPHSIRAVPIAGMKAIADFARKSGDLPLHLHISEQSGENTACFAEYGSTPISLAASNGILTSCTTLIHAIHLTAAEFQAVASSGATICSCPTTERNLGDGIFPADIAMQLGISIALGSDSQAQIDILEDARQLEYHLRLRDQQRGILDAQARQGWATKDPIGTELLRAATSNGYAALNINGGKLAIGQVADFFTVDIDDPSILGIDSGSHAESMASQAVFALSKSAVREVAIQGKLVLANSHHPLESEIHANYKAVQKRFLNN